MTAIATGAGSIVIDVAHIIIQLLMSITATFSTIPIREGDASDVIANAIETLDDYDVKYEVNPMGTIIETDDVDELFAAVQAAHQAVESGRVTTRLEINHERDRDRSATDRVAAVEEALSGGPETEASAAATEVEEAKEQDTVDMSGHAPEETNEDPEEDDIGMKGGDYKIDESEEANDESLSEKYNGTNGDS